MEPILPSRVNFPGFSPFVIPARALTGPKSEEDAHRLFELQRLGIVPGYSGGEYGYNSTGDLLTTTSDGFDLNTLWDEFIDVVNINNEPRDNLVSFLTFNVTNPVDRVPQAGNLVNFEVATEYGEPRGVRVKLTYFSMAYDLEWYDVGVRYTYRFLATAPASQLRALANGVNEADNRNIFTKVFRTIFNNVNLSATIEGQPYTVFKFYNNDGTTPPAYKTNTFLSTHNHYVTSGAATVDSADVEQLLGLVTEHGYDPSQGYQVVIMVNKAEGTQIRKFRLGQTNNNSAVANYDFIPAVNQPDFLLSATQQVVGARPAGTLNGLTVIGSYADALIIQDDFIPAGYMVCFATGGPRNLQNPVGFRQHELAGLQGLQLVKGPNPDYPLIDSFYQRVFGTGIRQRGGGAVMQITASGTYTIPTAYQ
jgi:hypothetical protein